ncbi:uncharacterized protein LOC6544090 [Drosophila erecta]|uniref:Uncharacterized protein n=1 Tax=Drosophila erecta TaxID=7220 RepID=B3NDF9_DROER|nr:uncharacterized protein LOC6544090 [Drosophila erecta]EDV52021.1 uncharacterized protein Dere_GG13592 [Drosophila erecta]
MQFVYLTLGLGLIFTTALQAAIIPLTLIKNGVGANQALPMDTEKFGYLEIKPNGSLILRRAPNQSGSNLPDLIMLKGVLQALKANPAKMSDTGGDTRLSLRIYGDGVEHKFPPLLENIIQRIQTYFSVYRYTDTSKPGGFQRIELTTPPTEDSPDMTTVKSENDDELIVVGEQDAYITVGDGAD